MALPAYLFDPPKKTTETAFVVVDFVNLFDTGVALSSVQVFVTRHSGEADASPQALYANHAILGTEVSVKTHDGVAGCTYKITIRATGDDTSIQDIDVLLPVVDERLG